MYQKKINYVFLYVKAKQYFIFHYNSTGPRLEKNMEAYLGADQTRSMEGCSSKFG